MTRERLLLGIFVVAPLLAGLIIESYIMVLQKENLALKDEVIAELKEKVELQKTTIALLQELRELEPSPTAP